ncbi:uncharacterized protein [Primulina huaijiensis]|uniref:uncharacterized protein isoform X2 n=1 Tax=Primulina huaijiensis TaxID=1492673 RepID=UPI003CC799DE
MAMYLRNQMVKLIFKLDVFLHSLSEDKLLHIFDSSGNQLFYLWSIFLNFHRANIKKILEFLRNQWTIDRKAEWSIWMIYTKVEMPHQYISSVVDESSYHVLRGKTGRKLTNDPAHTAAMRAELHRRSIAQMRGHHLDLRLVRNQWLLIDPKADRVSYVRG